MSSIKHTTVILNDGGEINGTNNLDLQVNGDSKMFITGTGNIGIGTVSPNYKLDVLGDLNFTGDLYRYGNLFSGSSQWTSSGANIYFNTGNIGIGLSNPQRKLDISGGNPKMSIYGSSQADIVSLFLSSPGSGLSTEAMKTAIISEGVNDWGRSKLHFCLNDDQTTHDPSENATILHSRMTLTPQGNVGIGSTIPSEKLDINGNALISGSCACESIATSVIYAASDLQILPGGGVGNVSIGTLSPLCKLHIKQSSDSSGAPSYSENSIICERSGSTDKWGIGVNTTPDLVFTLNENLKGYLDNNSNVDQIDFTGQHRCISENEIDISNKIGYIVSSNGNYNNLDNTTNPSINESLPVVKLSNESYDKAVYGVISNVEDASEIRKYSIGNFVSVFPKKDTLEKRIIINSVGEGGIFVSNINGNIENGDYITTSYIPGIGMRQNDNILHN